MEVPKTILTILLNGISTNWLFDAAGAINNNHISDEIVAGNVIDRGARKLIDIINSRKISAYLYGHTHDNKIFFDNEHNISSVQINNGCFKRWLL